jgi:hypothetical protein
MTYQRLPIHAPYKWTTPDNGKTWVTVCYCGWTGSDEEFERHLITDQKE